MATTTNYGWTTPDDTALVKDGASAIRTLGSSVDTTVKALSPGTTAGDVDYYTSSTAKARLAIGTTGQVLTVASGVPSWANVSAGGMTLLSTTTMSGSANIEVTSINQTYTDLFVEVYNMTWGTGNAQIYIDLNSDIYGSSANWIANTTVGNVQTNAVTLSGGNITNNTGNYYGMTINGYSSTAAYKSFNWSGGSYYTTVYAMQGAGVYMATAAISSIKIRNNGPYSFTGGTMRIWGIK